MIDKNFWEEQLKNLGVDELQEIQKLINKYKKSADTREEFLDVIKRFGEKYPKVRYFCTGSAGKGAYECEGEWWVNAWYELYNLRDVWDELVDYNDSDEDEKDGKGDIDILLQFKSEEEWTDGILNFYVKNDNEFKKAFNDSKHKPKWDVADAEDLYNGETMYEFIDLKTGESKYLYTSQY